MEDLSNGYEAHVAFSLLLVWVVYQK